MIPVGLYKRICNTILVILVPLLLNLVYVGLFHPETSLAPLMWLVWMAGICWFWVPRRTIRNN